jgi:hypothetical protein
MKDNMVSLISKWCRDLLEITTGQVSFDSTPDPIFQFQVGFLHRTVRDFLITGAMQKNLKIRAGNDFRPEATLSRIFLVLAKRVPRPLQDEVSRGGSFQYAAGNMMYYVRKHEVKYEETMPGLIHELDRIGDATYPPGNKTTWAGQPFPKNYPIASQAASSWSPIWDEGKELVPDDMVSSRMHRGRDLIAFAVEFDLQIFVRESLRHSRRTNNGRTPLLYHALSAVAPSELGLSSNSAPHAMVGLLLDMGANINISISTRPHVTLWRTFLHSISASKSPTTSSRDPTVSEASFPQRLVHEDESADVIGLEDGPKYDPAIRWHFSALHDVCQKLCLGTQPNSSQPRLALPQNDASLLELMLHHGAEPDEMDTIILHALLGQCCGDCRVRFTTSTAKETTWIAWRCMQWETLSARVASSRIWILFTIVCWMLWGTPPAKTSVTFGRYKLDVSGSERCASLL